MTVLAAVDLDHTPERVISVGYELADSHEEPLVATYVISEDEYYEEKDNREALPEEFREYSLEQAMSDVADRVETAVDETLEEYDRELVTTRGAVGSPAEEILGAVDEIDPSYVVVGGRNRSLTRQALFGSVSQQIVRQADRPVVTLMTDAES